MCAASARSGRSLPAWRAPRNDIFRANVEFTTRWTLVFTVGSNSAGGWERMQGRKATLEGVGTTAGREGYHYVASCAGPHDVSCCDDWRMHELPIAPPAGSGSGRVWCRAPPLLFGSISVIRRHFIVHGEGCYEGAPPFFPPLGSSLSRPRSPELSVGTDSDHPQLRRVKVLDLGPWGSTDRRIVPAFHFPFCSVTVERTVEELGGSSYFLFGTSQTLLHGCCHHVKCVQPGPPTLGFEGVEAWARLVHWWVDHDSPSALRRATRRWKVEAEPVGEAKVDTAGATACYDDKRVGGMEKIRSGQNTPDRKQEKPNPHHGIWPC
ncbi:hypothetical protein BC826DRAFT_970546 [Russula brevipes]|nr:hypothetical protein BC826DRAFT_970546 [Russula brevipes]